MRLFRRKEAAPPPQTKAASFVVSLGSATFMSRNARAFALEGYCKNPLVYACVSKIASSVASIDLMAATGTGADTKELPDHPMLGLLYQPNPLTPGMCFLEALVSYYLITGNAYPVNPLYDARTRTPKPPTELHLLMPDKVVVKASTVLGVPLAYEYRPGVAEAVTYPVDPLTGRSAVLHLKRFHPLDPWYGMSPMEAAAHSVDIFNQGQCWNMSLLQNGARPSGALVVKKSDGSPAELSEEQYQRLREQIDNQFSGGTNAGRPLLLEGGLEWQEMSLSPKDMDFRENMLTAARFIAGVYGVPPQLVNIPGESTFCLPAFERVETEHGPVPIAEVQPGEKVYSIDADGGMVLRRVLRSGKTGRKMVYRIETRNRTLYATDNHPILSRIDRFNGTHTDCRLGYRQVRDLKPGDVIVQTRRIARGSDRRDLDELEFIGHYLGDGTAAAGVRVRDGRGYRCGSRVSLACVPDTPKDHIYRSSLTRMIAHTGGSSGVGRTGRALYTACQPLYEYCEDAGILGTAKTKRLPEFVYNLDDEGKRAVIRGVIDSDGTVDANGRASLWLSNEALIRDLWHLCLSAGLYVGKVTEARRTATLPNGETFDAVMFGFMLSRAEDVLGIAPRTPQYYQRALANCGKPERSGLYVSSGKGYRKAAAAVLPANCGYGRIVRIEPVCEMDVYDIEVEETHNFIASGVVVHNSNYEQAELSFWQNTVLPLTKVILGYLNGWLAPQYGDDAYLKVDEDTIPALEPVRRMKSERVNNAGYMKIDEKREVMGMDATPGGGAVLVNSGLIPLDMAGEVPDLAEPDSEADKNAEDDE